MNSTLLRRSPIGLIAAVWLGACLAGPGPAGAATLAQFGQRAWQPPSSWNLLVILVTYTDSANPPNQAVFDKMFFGSPSVAEYFKENSAGRFTWTRAGTILLTLPSTNRYTNWEKKYGDSALPRYFSNMVAKAFATGQVNLSTYDSNNDKNVTQGEMDIVILSPPGEPGFSQPYVSVPQSSSGRTWKGYALGMLHNTSFATVNHELGHHCQAIHLSELDWSRAMDLYGRWDRGDGHTECLNNGLTLMACSGDYSFHFGAWEKLRFGWSEPRLRDLRQGGTAWIPAAQAASQDGPVLLYDSSRPNECFVVEYRAPSHSKGSLYEQNVPGSGLVIWHAQADSTPRPGWLADATLPTNAQSNWWWCTNCYGLFSATSTAGGGACKAGGTHRSYSNPTDFRLPLNNPTVAGEQGWRWCNKCAVLFYGPNQATSRCPAGNTHTATGSGQYTCPTDALPLYPRWNQVDARWRRCRKCQSMFNAGPKNTFSNCGAGGQHDGTGSPEYDFQMRMQRHSVGVRGYPDLLYGSNAQWPGRTVTPPLPWYDGTRSPARIYVQPFEPGAAGITIEWGATDDTWVDFAYTGVFEFGTFGAPYRILSSGLNAVTPGGTLHIKTGRTAATPRITRPMRIEAHGGPVTIGTLTRRTL
jgi:M6 family metalloprotease-like protein